MKSLYRHVYTQGIRNRLHPSHSSHLCATVKAATLMDATRNRTFKLLQSHEDKYSATWMTLKQSRDPQKLSPYSQDVSSPVPILSSRGKRMWLCEEVPHNTTQLSAMNWKKGVVDQAARAGLASGFSRKRASLVVSPSSRKHHIFVVLLLSFILMRSFGRSYLLSITSRLISATGPWEYRTQITSI